MIGTQTQREAKSRALVLGFLVAALIAASFLFAASPADADATFAVNKTGDAKDSKINGSCDTSPKKRGKQCTLRAAIQEANATIASDTIRFRIPASRDPNCDATTKVCTISPASALQITEPVTIDGYSQGKNTATTADDARPNTATTGTNAVLKIFISGINAETRPGIYVTGSNTTVKGLVISRFNGTAVIFFPDGGQPGENRLEGNFIGTDATGTTNLGNGIGVLASGFATGNNPSESKNEIIGGDTPAARNIISGNGTGVDTFFGRATIEGNLIGTDATGTANLGNGTGVMVTGSNSIIEGNTIAHSVSDGVEIRPLDPDDTSTSNRILSNSIFSNGGLGIDLVGGNEDQFGRTGIDGGDGDTGPNNLQNYPVISSAQEVSPVIGTRIQFSLNSTPNTAFTIQFFASPEKDPSGYGEGKTFLGEMQVPTDGTGNTSNTFTTDHSAASEGNFVTATATNNVTGDTSEFSFAVEVDPPEAQP
jgi:CSLREA domain-containing protein